MTKSNQKIAIRSVFCGFLLGVNGCDNSSGSNKRLSTENRMTLREARLMESSAREWAKKRIESSTHSKVVEINGFGWDEDNKCHVFGGMIDSSKSDTYKQFDIRIGVSLSGEWKV